MMVSEDSASKDPLALAQQRIQRLEAVVEASLKVNSTLDLRELAEYVIEIATRLIGAERGSLFLVCPGTGNPGDSGTLRSMVAQGLDQEALVLAVGEGIVGAVAANGEAMILNQPYGDPRFDPTVDQATGFHTSSLLTVPVRDRDGVLVAVLQLLNHLGGGFSTADVGFLAELGVPFAIALTTARLHGEIVARERLAKEMRMAAEIQHTLQPRDISGVAGLTIETFFRPCLEVGGDYFDVIPCSGSNRWWLVMADISGKGVSAGLIAANVQAYMWSRRNSEIDLTEVVAEGNELLCQLAQGHKYATMVVAEWSQDESTLTWVGAGHPPILLRQGAQVKNLGATGRPIGLLKNQSYSSSSVRLDAGDLFLAYTDGVLEAGMTYEEEEFGSERLNDCLLGPGGPDEVLERISASLRDHLGDSAPDDDITLLCARCDRPG